MFSPYIRTSLPNLEQDNHQITSPQDQNYNCIAWAAGEDDRKWWPDLFHDGYWPPEAPRTETIDAFIQAFKTKGYTVCGEGELVDGVEKVVLYVDASNKPTHMARQLSDGNWTSKCGDWCDISHRHPEVVANGLYGTVRVFLSRPIP